MLTLLVPVLLQGTPAAAAGDGEALAWARRELGALVEASDDPARRAPRVEWPEEPMPVAPPARFALEVLSATSEGIAIRIEWPETGAPFAERLEARGAAEASFARIALDADPTRLFLARVAALAGARGHGRVERGGWSSTGSHRPTGQARLEIGGAAVVVGPERVQPWPARSTSVDAPVLFLLDRETRALVPDTSPPAPLGEAARARLLAEIDAPLDASDRAAVRSLRFRLACLAALGIADDLPRFDRVLRALDEGAARDAVLASRAVLHVRVAAPAERVALLRELLGSPAYDLRTQGRRFLATQDSATRRGTILPLLEGVAEGATDEKARADVVAAALELLDEAARDRIAALASAAPMRTALAEVAGRSYEPNIVRDRAREILRPR